SEDKYKDAVSSQDTTAQRVWLDSVLNVNEFDWKIVVGHHPLYSGGKRINETGEIQRQLNPMLDRNEVDVYFAGHEHDLQYIKPDGPTHHIISGSGSETRPTGMIENSIFAKSAPGFVLTSISKSFILLRSICNMARRITVFKFFPGTATKMPSKYTFLQNSIRTRNAPNSY
ncbi:MAG: metallophosphoesterase, partial [Candidatus Omnitrophica bacterium]|nr:metallophosphoesterase [Candidatus Omnitrophota bacterium]